MASRIGLFLLAALTLAGCVQGTQTYPYFKPNVGVPPKTPPAVIRQPVVPEMLVPCRGHVLVPALGMIFVRQGDTPPTGDRFLREENLTAPYRVLPPGAFLSRDQSPARLNVELDSFNRIIGLYCG